MARRNELAELREALLRAVQGAGQLLLISGEPGIGKTRLADELAHEATRLGVMPLWGRCWETEGAPPYWPWLQVIRSFARAVPESVLIRHIAGGANTIASIAPWLPPRAPAVGVREPKPSDPETERFRLFDAVTVFLRNAASEHPLLLILDDLHAADRASLQLLQFLARHLPDSPILVLGTHRTHGPDKRLGQLVRVASRIPLRGLSAEDTASFIHAVRGITPWPNLVEAVYRVTEGNPLFTEEIVRALESDQSLESLVSGNLRLPARIHEAIRLHLEPLADECRTVLDSAAVIGREFRLAHIGRALPIPPLEMLDLLTEAVSLGVIATAGESPGCFRFSHALIREVIYEDLDPSLRAAIHRRIADSLEAGEDGTDDPGALAHHHLAAGRFGDVAKGILYSRLAGERAMAQFAYDQAAEHFGRAIAALETTATPDPGALCDLFLALAEAQWRGGEISKVRTTARRAAAIARDARMPDRLASAALTFSIGLSGYLGYSVTGRVDQENVVLLEEALAACPARYRARRSRLLGRLAVGLYWSEDEERKQSISRESVRLARRTGDPQTLASALIDRRFATWGPGGVAERLSITDEILSLTGSAQPGSRNREHELTAHQWRAMDYLEIGDLGAVDHAIGMVARLSEELRQPLYLAYVRLLRAMRSILVGRFDDAEREAAEALAAGQEAESPAAGSLFGGQMFCIRWLQGNLREFEGALSFLAQLDDLPAARGGLAMIYLSLGRESEARAEFERVAASDFASIPRDLTWLVGMSTVVQACAALGDEKRAAQLSGILRPYAALNAVVGPPPTACFGPVTYFLGLLSATMHRYEEAAAYHTIAFEKAERLQAFPILAHIFAARARARIGMGNAIEAAADLEEATGIAGRFGLTGLLAELRDLRARFSRPTSPPLQLGVARFRREGQYWTLGWHGRESRLPDSKGLRYLARLLREPGTEVHVADLVALAGGSDAASARGHAGEVADATARAQYRRRLEELQSRADRSLFSDEEARREIDFLTRELAAATGLGGRPRRAADSAERIRKSVTNRIRAAIDRIREADEGLGHHLEQSIRMGAFCVYAPSELVEWEL